MRKGSPRDVQKVEGRATGPVLLSPSPLGAGCIACTRKVRNVGRRLFVGNLPYETGEAELEEMFGKIGPVDSVRVMRDMATGRARGFAFVEMASDDDAQRAVDELNQAQLGGRTLAVNEARPKPAGGGFGGGAAAWWWRRGVAVAVAAEPQRCRRGGGAADVVGNRAGSPLPLS